MDTAVVDPDTAVEQTSSPSAEEQPETDVVEVAPETEDSEAPETEELTLEDPRVQELLKGERARLEESYRRKEEHARRQAQREEYDRARQEAYSNRVQNQQQKLLGLIKKVADEGAEPDSNAIAEILTETSSTGLIELVEGMPDWINSFLKDDNPEFYGNIPDEFRQMWQDAQITRRPDKVFEAALKVAAASGEARGWKAGQKATVQAIKAREAEKQKTQKIRKGSEAAAKEGTPAMGLSGSVPAKMTLEEIDKMPTSEWQNIPKEERARLLDEAHRAVDSAR